MVRAISVTECHVSLVSWKVRISTENGTWKIFKGKILSLWFLEEIPLIGIRHQPKALHNRKIVQSHTIGCPFLSIMFISFWEELFLKVALRMLSFVTFAAMSEHKSFNLIHTLTVHDHVGNVNPIHFLPPKNLRFKIMR